VEGEEELGRTRIRMCSLKPQIWKPVGVGSAPPFPDLDCHPTCLMQQLELATSMAPTTPPSHPILPSRVQASCLQLLS
jgi:hypothetical protein